MTGEKIEDYQDTNNIVEKINTRKAFIEMMKYIRRHNSFIKRLASKSRTGVKLCFHNGL